MQPNEHQQIIKIFILGITENLALSHEKQTQKGHKKGWNNIRWIHELIEGVKCQISFTAPEWTNEDTGL